MVWGEDWTDIATALGVGVDDLAILIIFGIGFLAMAKDYKIGLVFWLLFYSLAFIFFYLFGKPTFKLLIAIFVSLLFMALSLYSSYQKQTVV